MDWDWRPGFKSRVKARMKALGLTQYELADRLGLGQPTVSKYVNGHVAPTPDVLYRWGAALECDGRELLPPLGEGVSDVQL